MTCEICGESIKTGTVCQGCRSLFAPSIKKEVVVELSNEGWLTRYYECVLPFLNAVGGPRHALCYEIVEAIRKREDVGQSVSTQNVRKALSVKSASWRQALEGDNFVLLAPVVKYYKDWARLPRSRKQEIGFLRAPGRAQAKILTEIYKASVDK